MNSDAVFTSLPVTVGGNVHLMMENEILLEVRSQVISKKSLSALLLDIKLEEGGEKMSLKLNTLQIEKLPETSDTETWTKFNERLNDLAHQGYIVLRATETYILFSRKKAAIRREE